MLKRIVLALMALLVPVLTISGAGKTFTLVIDAGHGGHDSGAKGAISFEKNLTLRYALAFGKMVEEQCPDVRVIYTRKKDIFLPLHERAEIANRNKADLFLSIHINALEPGHISRGFQSYTLGMGERTGKKGLKENLEVAKRENSVIFMEKDYQKNYKGLENSAESDIMFEFIADKNRERSVELSRLMQREVCKATGRHNGGAHQNNLAVLRLTSMPAALLELGFITTPDEETFLNTDTALEAYVRGMFNAFVIYKNKYGGTIDVPYRESSDTVSSALIGNQVASRNQKDEGTDSTPANRNRQRIERQNSGSNTKVANNISASTNRNSSNNKNASNNRNASNNKKVEKKPITSQPVFKVQVFSTTVKVKEGDPTFKGLKGCDYYKEGNYYKYTYGADNNYNTINRLRKEVAEKFPQSFIVAFKDGKKMNTHEAKQEFLANKKKK